MTQHWHFSTYWAISVPAKVTAEFSPPFASVAEVKTHILHHVNDVVTTDEAALDLIALPAQYLRDAAREWTTMPDEQLFFYYFPWIHEIYPCSGACADAAYDNAREMAQWLTGNGVVDAEIAGTPAQFTINAQPPTRRSTFTPKIVLDANRPR